MNTTLTLVSLTALDICLSKSKDPSHPGSASEKEAVRSLQRSGIVHVRESLTGIMQVTPTHQWNEFETLASNTEAWETTKKTLGVNGKDEHSLLAVLQTLEKNINGCSASGS